MNAHEHTDPHGDGLTITHDDGKVWITCTAANAEVTVGPLAAGILTDYDMDGGVAAALIEKEAEESAPSVDYHAMWWNAERERENAERERDEALAARARAQAMWMHDRITESRPLTPDAPTGAMAARAMLVLAKHGYRPGHAITHEALAAALTEPPARPEGAEELGELIGTWTATEGIAPADLPTGSLATLADFLAERGVRVPEDDGGDETPDVCPHVGGPGGDCGCPL